MLMKVLTKLFISSYQCRKKESKQIIIFSQVVRRKVEPTSNSVFYLSCILQTLKMINKKILNRNKYYLISYTKIKCS